MAGQPDFNVLKAVLGRYNIHIAEANDLVVLQNYDIVIIADDSGSMRARTNLGTRWSELKETVGLCVDIACCFDADGIDIYFLNRGDIKGVKSANDPRVVSAFASTPNGSTPLNATLERLFDEQSFEKPLLVMIATDGTPNGGTSQLAGTIRNSLRDPRKPVLYQMLAYSDQDHEIAWMNDLDEKFNEVDATDDYETEKAEVFRAGLARRFDRNDWVMKALLGPVSKKFDAWDMGAHKRQAGWESDREDDKLCHLTCCIS